MSCDYCYAGEKRSIHMRQEIAEKAVEFVLREAQIKQIESLNIMFFGGEPLLCMDLLCTICQLFETKSSISSVSYSLSTNGILLNPANIEKLSKHRVYVSLSLDGAPDVQDQQRPFSDGRGSSEVLTQNIPRLLEWNPCADSRFVVTPATAGGVSNSVFWIASQGFKYITMALDYSAHWNMADLAVLKNQLKIIGKWYEQKLIDNKPIYLNCFDERISSRTKPPLGCFERCSVGIGQYSIAPSGRIYPCVQFVGDDSAHDYVIGDIHNGFDERKRSRIFELGEQEKPECSGCQLAGRCSSWCACSNWSSSGQIDRASPIVCEFERIIMPIADKIGNKLWKKRSRPFIHRFYNPAFPVLDFAEQLIVEEVPHD
ncbi:MAG: SPASM domain-containing protein [Planctomycetes bacterium]|nr:SPASM domain-containing protein [Planctomycetota bacterium]